MRLTMHRVLLAGIAVTVFSGLGMSSAGSAGNGHIDVVAPQSASVAPASAPLPGNDATVPVAAFALLAAATSLGWVVRRSAPTAVVTAPTEALAPVRDLSSHRAPAVTSPAAA